MDNGSIAVKDGISMVGQAGKSFGDILDDINHISSQMQDVSAVTEEISAGTHNMLSSIENVAKISTESSENAENVVAVAVDLQGLMSSFKL
jgi:methyl-accepting chemotaxis protein